MALDAKVLTVQCPAGTGSQAYTGVGFQPKALVFFYTSSTADGAAAEAQWGMGFATASSEQYTQGIAAQDNVADANTGRYTLGTGCVGLQGTAGATLLNAQLTSLDADGFTLNWTTVTSGADLHVLALGGSSLTDAYTHLFSAGLPTSTGSNSYTGFGFQPEALLVILYSFIGSGSGDIAVALSATDGTTEASLSVFADDAATTALGGHYFTTSKFMAIMDAASVAVGGESDFTSFDADGFTINVTNAYPTNHRGAALGLNGISAKVGTITAPAGTGTQAYTGVGFQPDALILFGAHDALNTVAESRMVGFVGAGTAATERACIAWDYTEGSDPTQADRYSDSANIVRCIAAGTPTVDLAADLDSLDSDGFTLDWTTVGTGASTDQIVYVALGVAGAPAATARSQAVFVG